MAMNCTTAASFPTTSPELISTINTVTSLPFTFLISITLSFILYQNTVTSLPFTFLISITLSIMLYQKTAANTKTSKLPLPPGPKPWPLVGNIPEMIKQNSKFRWIEQLMKEMNTDICLIRLGNTNIVPVNCPILAREILKVNDAAFATRPLAFSARTVSGGYLTTIVTPSNDQWKKMRKILISEMISPARHKWLHNKRVEEADNLVFYINNLYKANKNVDLRIATRHYCGSLIIKMLFGKRYFGKGMSNGGPGKEELEHMDAVFVLLRYLYGFCISDFVPLLSGFDLDGHKKSVVEATTIIRDYQDPLIDQRIRLWRNGQRKEMEDLLDIFITLQDSDGKPVLTPDEIKHQFAELMLAGIDNPANAVEWTIGEMINNPEIMKKAMEEIDKEVGKDRLVQESDIQNLNYVKACIREAYRLHPVASFIPPHLATKDTEIAGYLIPKGSWVMPSRYGLGRNPNTWPNPLKFDPERHLINEGNVVLTENECRFISFGTGRRGCIAAGLGSCMTVMLLARMIQCFTWTPPGNATTVDLAEGDDNLSPANPVVAFATPRLPPHLYPTTNP